jgi:hypothetical protein
LVGAVIVNYIDFKLFSSYLSMGAGETEGPGLWVSSRRCAARGLSVASLCWIATDHPFASTWALAQHRGRRWSGMLAGGET